MLHREAVKGGVNPESMEHLAASMFPPCPARFRVVRTEDVRLLRRMIEEHIEQLRSRLEQAAGLPEGARAELLGLVDAVRRDAGLHPVESGANAPSQPETEEQSGIGRLLASVDELEASHPELAASINKVADTLAKMGI